MNNKQHSTLKAIFESPTRTNIKWKDATSMIKAAGGCIENRDRSRRWIAFEGAAGMIHAPHPGNEMKRYSVRDLKDILSAAGILPE